MNRHERCFSAIQGKQVDRPPRYIPGIACDVASEILGRPVHTGTGSLHYAETCALAQGAEAHEEFVHNLFEDLAEINRTLDVDVYRIPWRQTRKPAKQIDDLTFLFGDPDGNHTIYQYSPDSGEFGAVRHVIRTPARDPMEALKASVEAEEQRIAEGVPNQVGFERDFEKVARKYGDEFFVVCNGGGISVGYSEPMLMALVLEPDLVRRRLMTQARRAVALGKLLAGTEYPKVLVAGGDLAGNNGPFFSPKSFREVYLPVLKYLFDELEGLGVHYIFRTDGNIWAIADMLFEEAGCPGYGEVDRDAGMTVEALREKYPNLVLWNNFSCNRLGSESADWVREEAARCIDASGGTRYFHGCSNAIMKGTPKENVLAMFG